MSAQKGEGADDGGASASSPSTTDDARRPAAAPLEEGGRRLLSLLAPGGDDGGGGETATIDSDAVARLLSYLKSATTCATDTDTAVDAAAASQQEKNQGADGGERAAQETFDLVVLAALNVAQSTSPEGVVCTSGKLARRIVVDGLLPLANLVVPPDGGGGGLRPNQGEGGGRSDAVVVSAGLIMRCVDAMLPVAMISETGDRDGEDGGREVQPAESAATTVALELLLPPYLARLDAVLAYGGGADGDEGDRSSDDVPTGGDADHLDFVDDALDRLCTLPGTS